MPVYLVSINGKSPEFDAWDVVITTKRTVDGAVARAIGMIECPFVRELEVEQLATGNEHWFTDGNDEGPPA